MIEIKIKELLEQYFLNISNYEIKRIYFGNNYQTELIRFDFDNFDINLDYCSIVGKEIQNICNKYSTYLVEPEIKVSDKTVQIKFRYFTRVK